jgi:hypothetical protein
MIVIIIIMSTLGIMPLGLAVRAQVGFARRKTNGDR